MLGVVRRWGRCSVAAVQQSCRLHIRSAERLASQLVSSRVRVQNHEFWCSAWGSLPSVMLLCLSWNWLALRTENRDALIKTRLTGQWLGRDWGNQRSRLGCQIRSCLAQDMLNLEASWDTQGRMSVCRPLKIGVLRADLKMWRWRV